MLGCWGVGCGLWGVGCEVACGARGVGRGVWGVGCLVWRLRVYQLSCVPLLEAFLPSRYFPHILRQVLGFEVLDSGFRVSVKGLGRRVEGVGCVVEG